MDEVNTIINTSHTLSPRGQDMPVVYYSGTIDAQSISALLAQVKKKLSTLNTSSDTCKRILGIMTELLQNISHHGPPAVFENKETAHSFLFEKRKEGFLLTTTNIIHADKVAALKKRITALNSCTDVELKSLYQNILNHGKREGENAGLGLIDIIRKSGNKILFKFAPLGNKYCLFTVKVPV